MALKYLIFSGDQGSGFISVTAHIEFRENILQGVLRSARLTTIRKSRQWRLEVTLMRIWDIPPEKMCRQHLLGEHRELHALWSIITNNKKAYANHPETLRWKGKLKALYLRHEALVEEMLRRGYNHHSPLGPALATGKAVQDELVYSYEEQVKTLRERGRDCRV